jgi:hypothetical protein
MLGRRITVVVDGVVDGVWACAPFLITPKEAAIVAAKKTTPAGPILRPLFSPRMLFLPNKHQNSLQIQKKLHQTRHTKLRIEMPTRFIIGRLLATSCAQFSEFNLKVKRKS